MKCLVLGTRHGGNQSYADAFSKDSLLMSFAFIPANKVTVSTVTNVDVVLFCGGSDVNPEMYGETAHKSTHFNVERDHDEAAVFDMCIKTMTPMIGICRGSQFLTVMSGGKLVQNVMNHCRHHKMTYHNKKMLKEGLRNDAIRDVDVSSTHHQMMYPFTLADDKYDLFGFSLELSTVYEGRPREDKEFQMFEVNPENFCVEPEMVYYKETKALAVQYHPEMMTKTSDGFEVFNQAVRDYITQELFNSKPVVV